MTKPTKAQKIRDYIASHPDKTVKQIATTLRVIPAYVYKIKAELKPKKIILSRTQVEVANKLGISKKDYAEQVYKLTVGRNRAAQHKTTREEKIVNPGVYEVPVDNVNQPAHYKVGGVETIDFIEAKDLGYNLGNAVKYISRAEHKGNFREDLLKARWYIERELAKTVKVDHGSNA